MTLYKLLRRFFVALSVIASFAAAFIVVSAPASAQTLSSELGPPVGAQIPHDLTVNTARAGEKTFADLAGEKGLALFFVRSVDWCPYCKSQANDVNDRLKDFTDRGLNVAFVSYDEPYKQKKFADGRQFKPILISDQNIELINAFNLRNEKHSEGSRFYGIPHPAVFIINPDKTVAAKLYEEDYAVSDKSYRNRPAVDIIVKAIDDLQPQ